MEKFIGNEQVVFKIATAKGCVLGLQSKGLFYEHLLLYPFVDGRNSQSE